MRQTGLVGLDTSMGIILPFLKSPLWSLLFFATLSVPPLSLVLETNLYNSIYSYPVASRLPLLRRPIRLHLKSSPRVDLYTYTCRSNTSSIPYSDSPACLCRLRPVARSHRTTNPQLFSSKVSFHCLFLTGLSILLLVPTQLPSSRSS